MNKRKKFLLILVITFFIMLGQISYAANDIIVVLDPGHGGSDSGAVRGEVIEKNVNWKIASEVKRILDQTPGIKAIMTRGENENPTLRDRGLLAKNVGADLLVSFHINSNPSSSVRGSETYVTGNVNSTRFYQASKALGETVQNNLANIGIPKHLAMPRIRLSKDDERYSDGFITDYYGIIRNPMYYGIPGVLLEHCFISNPVDRAEFLNDSKIAQIGRADADAIIQNKERFRINRENNATNAQISKLEVDSSKTHLSGEVVIVDWINGMQSVPTTLPSIKLITEDGSKIVNCYVTQVYGNTFYFDTWLNNISDGKKYKVEIQSNDRVNVPTKYTVNLNLGNNRNIGEDNTNYYKIESNMVKAENKEYIGDLNSDIQKLNVIKTSTNGKYLTGEIVAVEWVNGKSNVPRQLPVMRLKSTDGSINKKCYVKNISGNTYYFDILINDIQLDKEYTLEIASENPYNLSTNKIQTVKLSKLPENVGKIDDKVVKIKEDKISFEDYTYIGNINSELYQFNVGKQNGATYVSGEIVVVEWVDGKSTVPEKKPKMRFKSIDGKVNMEVYVTATGTNTYYFDRYIEGIDTSKEYYFEIESGDSRNVSENRKMNVYYTRTKFDDTIVGKYHDKKIRLKRQKITFEEDTYVGNINSELYQFNVGEQNGATYVSGEIVVVEWVDGKSTVPEKKPKMRFKSIDGKVNMEVYVTATGTNTYYFDRYIEGIDTSKEYYFEIESGDSRNISPNRKMNVYFKGKFNNLIVGEYRKDISIILEDNLIKFKNKTNKNKEEIENIDNDKTVINK